MHLQVKLLKQIELKNKEYSEKMRTKEKEMLQLKKQVGRWLLVDVTSREWCRIVLLKRSCRKSRHCTSSSKLSCEERQKKLKLPGNDSKSGVMTM